MPNVDLDYDMSGNRTAYCDCPLCDGGTLEIAITEKGKPGRVVTSGCPESCRRDIDNGKADEAILEAVAIAVKMDADTDWSDAWNRRYAESGGGSTDPYSHRLREAQKLK
jgi:hypothetical protein